MKSLASLGQITVFVRVAELGSLTAAAKELEITPSAVSKSLAQLEAHLGMHADHADHAQPQAHRARASHFR
ncbi:helix-turn-helix domain-containing protein [Pandoraea terrae]|uniref:helix-turn-helix domain-containing protein n=1 Tax=Pandoraea terrae TaxID=1537710 RepID=UPI00124173BC